MTFRPAVVLLALHLGAVPALAQRDEGFQRWPGGERAAAPTPTPQVQQGARSRERPSSAPAPQSRAGRTERVAQSPNDEPVSRPPGLAQTPQGKRETRTAAQRRPSGQSQQGSGGSGPRVAVPRQGPAPRAGQGPGRPGPNVYAVRPPAYRYTPRFYSYGWPSYGWPSYGWPSYGWPSYGWGVGWGRPGPGYFYYGSFGWYPGASYYDGGYFGRGYGYDFGEVRLRVEPRGAEVYVDGTFAGTVDDFDGSFQSLKLEAGPYHLEIVSPGYETLEVDLRITPGQKITYRGELRPGP